MMRCGSFALEDGDWEEHKTIFKVEVSATNGPSKEYARPLEKWQKMKREA